MDTKITGAEATEANQGIKKVVMHVKESDCMELQDECN